MSASEAARAGAPLYEIDLAGYGWPVGGAVVERGGKIIGSSQQKTSFDAQCAISVARAHRSGRATARCEKYRQRISGEDDHLDFLVLMYPNFN